MNCPKCGTFNDDNAYRCITCSEVLHGLMPPFAHGTAPSPVNNNLVLAVVVTVLCCLPLGIVGIIHAAQVNTKAQHGDLAGAEESARKARLWSFWGLGVGLVIYSGYALLALAGALANLSGP